MNLSMSWKLLISCALFSCLVGYVYSSVKVDQTLIISDIVNDDLYAAGENIQVTARVHGDITAAAQRISIEDTVDGDINIAAEVINILAPIADDMRAAGRLITISAEIGDHLVAAGESITINSKASIQGWARLAGRQLIVLGDINKDLTAAGQHVTIAGHINGDASITADNIVIQSSARINGKLRYRSPNEPDIQSGAEILGGLEQIPMPDTEAVSTAAVQAILGLLLVFGLALIIVGIAYILIFPHFSLASARTISEQTLQSIGLGAAVLITTPFIILLLMMTVVGYLLALCLLAVYLLVILFGLLTGMLYFSDLALRRIFKQAQSSKAKRIVTFIVTTIIIYFLILIPILGALLLLFMLVAGIGAIQLQLWQKYSTSAA